MDEIRVQALRHACLAMRGAPFTEITKAAESFEQFLRGNPGNCELADMGAGAIQATQETVGQPSATDLSQADQTPGPYVMTFTGAHKAYVVDDLGNVHAADTSA